MKKIIYLLFFLFTSLLFPNDVLDDFITEQLKIESQLLDQNLSLEQKIEIKDSQDSRYQEFLLQYASNKEEYLQQDNPYKRELNKLQLRLNSNKYRGNTNAALRDELLIKGYKLRAGIREAFHEVMMLTESESKSFFKDKINETLVKYFSKYTPLDKEKYITADQDPSSPIVQSLNEAMKNLEYLESVANTFSAELVANSSYIYRTGRLSKSRFFSFLKKINNSPFAEDINVHLAKFHLDIASILFVLTLIIIILITQYLLRFMIDRTLKHYSFDEEDIEYIHTHITKLFKLIATLLIIHLILVVYLGLDITSVNVSKLFSIVYVILFTVVIYRITNTIAYLKMESIRSSQLLKNEVINLTIKVSNTLLILAAIIAILKIVGVNLTALLSGLGIAGAAVAFAAKDSIANLSLIHI